MRPFGYPVTILNTLDPLGKFQEKVDERFLVGYSVCSKTFRTMNYHSVIAENQSNTHAGFQDIEKAREEGTQTYVLFLVLSDGFTNSQNNNKDAHADGKEHDDDIQKSMSPDIHSSSSEYYNNSSNGVNAASSSVSTAGKNSINSTNDFSAAGPSNAAMPNLEDLSHDADDVGAEANINNLESIISKSVSPDIHSTSIGAQTRNQGDKTENKDKGKSPVVTITGFKDLNVEFKEYNNNSSNGVNAASSLVSTARQNSIDNTNDFSAAGPSNAAMPNLEDLSHNADDVGAKANINNLESIISVSPIPTTRIHKDHPTSQIIGDLSSTTQTRSMARAVRDQGGISLMFNEDFHTCMFA
nr:hypothetical protein [Tanacetum cinerariifolium]